MDYVNWRFSDMHIFWWLQLRPSISRFLTISAVNCIVWLLIEVGHVKYLNAIGGDGDASKSILKKGFKN